jgi:hypothetical protein
MKKQEQLEQVINVKERVLEELDSQGDGNPEVVAMKKRLMADRVKDLMYHGEIDTTDKDGVTRKTLIMDVLIDKMVGELLDPKHKITVKEMAQLQKLLGEETTRTQKVEIKSDGDKKTQRWLETISTKG